ncbi:Protein MAINTENANCE OF PSII UNDER HIGH LIGHT 1 [Camellia lanceoleosa]|uniref:Protein MAINTENANCE OF PSII UNDER HIGH LIGHT 1 n=1 Tax=Camellia lanceoleosa TaxID=1840588 RepID=A0ACC0IS39_9ERIC|nr:Protein MAINTENANCE OF PSII UNDER HIGH LIGHT 1 [Camellia lanceoleosa]
MVGSGSQAVMLSANSGASLVTSSRPSRLLFLFFNNNNRYPFRFKKSSILRPLRASSDEPDCNVEECAPDKEVGKVSVEWLAGEKTKVLGTFPPRNRGWTGYVEKDTAGQTNIYSVEPAVYVAESAISSGTAGSSADGSENAKALVTGLALISIAAAVSILLQVGKNSPPQIQTAEYSGPSLAYYINKFKPQEIIQAQAQTETEISESNALQVSKVELES